MNSLFEAFSQADASTTRHYGGTGLGLSIAQRLCLLMGGDLTATSQMGEGSRFTFTLPLTAAKTRTSQMPEVDFSDLFILIVDGNTTNLNALENQLRSWGANVITADSGVNAISTLIAHAPTLFDVVLLDMQMPNMDGATLAKTIRMNPIYGHTPLAMLTSMTERGDASFFADLGFAAYLPKPVAPSDLKDALKIIVTGGGDTRKCKTIGHKTSHFKHSSAKP